MFGCNGFLCTEFSRTRLALPDFSPILCNPLAPDIVSKRALNVVNISCQRIWFSIAREILALLDSCPVSVQLFGSYRAD